MNPMLRRFVLAFAASAAACGKAPTEGAPPRAGGSARLVSVVAVAPDSAATTPVSGSVQARRRASLSARVPASVLELPYREGDRVAAGAVVVRLDDAAMLSAVQAAEAAERAAEAERVRMESLRSHDAATPREVDEAAARAAAAHAAVLAARDNLAYAALRSPFSGVVVARPANVGDVATPGTALIEIEGDGGYEVRATLDAGQAASLRPGAVIQASIDGLSELQQARITALSPAADPTTHRFEVRADLATTTGLRSGLFVRLLVASDDAQPRLFVPSSAFFTRGGLTGIFVSKEGMARLRWVAPGAAADGRTEVRAGVEAGERVIVDPAGLEDGVAVTERP
jgi:RND family efflux transporter MFP subunit